VPLFDDFKNSLKYNNCLKQNLR
ncbi:hypothetical protein SNEBB_000674, partial [Seison nebaliae]